MTRKLWVGLGNPGRAYEFTRHNIGALVVNWIAEEFNAIWSLENRFQAKIAKISILDQELTLMLPQTFMNNSGEAVAAYTNFFQVPVQNILIWHDELDLPLGEFRGKVGGGLNGHNGLRSVASLLGSSDFNRMRVGIGRPQVNIDIKDFVISRFLDSELATFKSKWQQLKLKLSDLNSSAALNSFKL